MSDISNLSAKELKEALAVADKREKEERLEIARREAAERRARELEALEDYKAQQCHDLASDDTEWVGFHFSGGNAEIEFFDHQSFEGSRWLKVSELRNLRDLLNKMDLD